VNYLELFNEVIKVACPINTAKAKATSMDQELKDTGLDSLDMLMVSIYLAEIFGVAETVAKEVKPTTVGDLIAYMKFHRTKDVESVEDAIKSIQ